MTRLLLSPVFLAVFTTSILSIFLIPFTKVEESFNLQAIHDFIYIGFPRFFAFLSQSSSQLDDRRWDHEDYPGELYYGSCYGFFILGSQNSELNGFIFHVIIDTIFFVNASNEFSYLPTGAVPRTFLGALLVALCSYPFQFFKIISDKFSMQLVVRITIALFTSLSFTKFSEAVRLRYGMMTRNILVMLTLAQYHFLFYSSRPLPNSFAMVLVLLALSAWIRYDFNLFLVLVASSVVIVRFETALIFGWIILYEVFVTKKLTLAKVFCVGIPAGILWLLLTVYVDSLMWDTLVWPEGYGIYYNVYLQKSQDWGVSPFAWYFYSALPKLFGLTILLAPFANENCLKFFLISLAFISTYSFLGHKELRFIIYAVPLVNICTANALALLYENSYKIISNHSSPLLHSIINFLTPLVNFVSKTPAVPREFNADLWEPKPKDRDLKRRFESKDKCKEQEKVKETDKKTDKPVISLKSRTQDYLAIIFAVILAIVLSSTMIFNVIANLASVRNYPGGDAAFWLNQRISSTNSNRRVGVYVSNLAAQTGFSRFLEVPNVFYDKSPDFDAIVNGNKSFSYVNNRWIKEDPRIVALYLILEEFDKNKFCRESLDDKISTFKCDFGTKAKGCRLMRTFHSFERIQFDSGLTSDLVKTKPVLWLFKC